MTTTIFVASSNVGKLRDFSIAAAEAGKTASIAVDLLPGLSDIPPAPENEDTFAGNARSKAVYYSNFMPGRLVLADDSGLEVDALNGAPGVRSARYAEDAGIEPTAGETVDQANNGLLLANLAAIHADQRQARYQCVLALARDGKCLLTADGHVDGQILTQPTGIGGFGYDPLFFLPELGLTMAQIDLETKYRLSHRGRAFRALLDLFKDEGSL
jgi:XTP/dITP diphosphohydrolase